MNSASRPLLFATFLPLLLACHSGNREERPEQVGQATVTGANARAEQENASAVLQIVEARCAREVSCNTIGDGHPWASKEGCVQEMHARLETELKPARCPNGIDQNSLGLCLDSIRNETCENPMETLARASACRSAKLCLSAREP